MSEEKSKMWKSEVKRMIAKGKGGKVQSTIQLTAIVSHIEKNVYGMPEWVSSTELIYSVLAIRHPYLRLNTLINRNIGGSYIQDKADLAWDDLQLFCKQMSLPKITREEFGKFEITANSPMLECALDVEKNDRDSEYYYNLDTAYRSFICAFKLHLGRTDIIKLTDAEVLGEYLKDTNSIQPVLRAIAHRVSTEEDICHFMVDDESADYTIKVFDRVFTGRVKSESLGAEYSNVTLNEVGLRVLFELVTQYNRDAKLYIDELGETDEDVMVDGNTAFNQLVTDTVIAALRNYKVGLSEMVENITTPEVEA